MTELRLNEGHSVDIMMSKHTYRADYTACSKASVDAFQPEIILHWPLDWIQVMQKEAQLRDVR